MPGPVPGAAALIDDLLASPPAVHRMGDGATGAWSTDRACYEALAAAALASAAATGRPCRSLETGSGVSTALLAGLGCEHTAVSPSADELARMADDLDARGIDRSAVRLVVGSSDDVLPGLEGELDLVFVDGGHGHPVPTLDAWFGGRRLRAGGVLVLDDVQLPAVAAAARWLDADPAWTAGERTAKWAAFHRAPGRPVLVDHVDQPWAAAALGVGGRAALRQLAGVARRRLGRVGG